MKIMEVLKKNGMTVGELANELDISATQIYLWNKNGISSNNRYFPKLQSMFPDLTPKDPTLRVNEKEDRRYNSGKKKKHNLPLTETDMELPTETEFASTLFPKITIRKKSQ